jgi:4-amino-4-deoxy-L-arabinose transferase-like glycosyltransferase
VDRRSLALLLLLAVLAFGLRFARLDWSFSGDETTTILEEGVLFRGLPADPESQIYKLPRVNPLGYLLHHAGYRAFGFDERGTRTMGAIFGALHVLIVFLLLRSLLGVATAFATAALILFWPDHLAACQDNRFYVFAAFFVSLSLLLGGQAVKRRSPQWMVAAVLAAFLAVLSHAVQGILLGTLASGLAAAALAEKKKPHPLLVMVVGTGILFGLAYFAFRLVPLTRGWNQGSGWGYSTPHAVLAASSSLGFPVALMVPAGALLLFQKRTPEAWYWLACSLSWVFVVVVLPNAVVYHPPYAFPLEVTAVVLAGSLLGELHHRLRERSVLLASVFLGLAVLVNLPGVVSHLKDGSRYDYRTIGHRLESVLGAGDGAAARSPDLLKHYAPSLGEVQPIYVDRPRADYDTLLRAPRTWVVVHHGRAGLPDPLDRFLAERCVPELDVEAQRFDYYQFRTALYLCTKTSSTTAGGS